MTQPRRDRYIAPGTGPDTAAVIDAAIESLAAARNFEIPDATITLPDCTPPHVDPTHRRRHTRMLQ
jgi:hypothetical protein